MQSNTVKVKRGQELTREGQTGHKAFILQTGWACGYKLLPDGGRQIISFPLAGDIVGLRSILLRTADHSFSALTDAAVNPVEGMHIVRCIGSAPRCGAHVGGLARRSHGG
jgi:CRP-like cAMP-binding protein